MKDTEEKFKPINFVFGIGDTLALKAGRDESPAPLEGPSPADYFGADYVGRLSLCCGASKVRFIVYPGMFELWRWLRGKGHSCMFFGSGAVDREDDFARRFMKEVVAGERGSKRCTGKDLRNKMRVLSGCFMVDTHWNKRWNLKSPYHDQFASVFPWRRRKPLENLVCTRAELPYTLLVDACRGFAAKGELGNYVAVPHDPSLDVDPYDRDWTEEEPEAAPKTEMDGYRDMFKSCYLAGFFRKMFEEMEANRLTAVEAAKKLQIDAFTANELTEDFDFPLLKENEFYRTGFEIIKEHALPEDKEAFRLPEVFNANA